LPNGSLDRGSLSPIGAEWVKSGIHGHGKRSTGTTGFAHCLNTRLCAKSSPTLFLDQRRLSMNGRPFGLCLLATAVLLGGSESSGEFPPPPGQNVAQATRCGLADLRGTYGFFRSGTTAQGPLAAVGVAQADGDGNMTVAQTTSRNGTITQGSFALTYEITPDCRGIWYDASGVVNAHIVLLDGGNELFFLSVSAGNTVYGHSKRITPVSR
jgi:hypothetical protein